MIMMIKTTDKKEGPQAPFLVGNNDEVEINQCACGNDKFAGHRACKRCAVEQDRFKITIEPGHGCTLVPAMSRGTSGRW